MVLAGPVSVLSAGAARREGISPSQLKGVGAVMSLEALGSRCGDSDWICAVEVGPVFKRAADFPPRSAAAGALRPFDSRFARSNDGHG